MLYTTSLKFPRLFNIVEGNSQIDKNFESINRSIALIILTGKGELFGNPNYGSDIKKYQFKEITPELINLLADEIVDAVKKFENRVEINSSDITITQNGDTVNIEISYTLANSNLMSNTTVILPISAPREV